MTVVQHASSTRNVDVFNAVFSKTSIRAPVQRQQFDHKSSLNIDAIKLQLLEDSRSILGVGVEDYGHILSNITRFQTYFPLSASSQSNLGSTPVNVKTLRSETTKTRSYKFLLSWKTDFGITRLDKAFASAVDKLITEFITWSYSGAHTTSGIDHLQFWIRNLLWPYVSFLHAQIHGIPVDSSRGLQPSHLQTWTDMAITRLADQRIAELFDIIVDWDTTAAAVDDLSHFTINTAARSYLTSDFAATLSRRLLQPGASTIEILQVYISIIKAFRRLDAKGVLLERVARKIRRYLREREDTIKVVVAGLLADITEEAILHDSNILGELAVELQQRDARKSRSADAELDWNNMDWMPDPVDAAPDYMKSKNTDVIGSLISLFESKDVFVKELQTTLADRLLKNKADFDQEIGVVEHLKIRFGDAILQGCEVMLRDVLDSRKVDQVIRQDQAMTHQCDDKVPSEPEVHVKILSRLFWPSLQEQTFKVPLPVQAQQAKYEKGFESLKQSRKLTWLNAIGQVEVQLELEDRTVREEVLPWQASVIYTFQETPTQSLGAIEQQLAMTPALARSACMFWAAKRVLAEVSGEKDTFTVLERLPTRADDDATSGDAVGQSSDTAAATAAAAAEMAAAQAAREVEETERKQKMAMYHQFIVSMLTNQGAMPLPRVAMMLGIVVPGGFPFGNEELREFMNGMVKDGVLEIGAGGAYKIAS